MLTKLLLIIIAVSAFFMQDIQPEENTVLIPQGLVEMYGEAVIEPEKDNYGYIRVCFDDTRPVEGYYPVNMSESGEGAAIYGYIDTNGKIVIQPQFLYADAFSDGYASVVVQGTYEDLFGVTVTNPSTYINVYGEHCIGYFSKAQSFSENRAVVTDSESNSYLIDSSGEIIKKLSDDMDFCGKGMSCSRLVFHSESTGLYGFFDENGNVAIEPVFSEAHSFSEGLAAVILEDGSLGYIDILGNVVINTKEDDGYVINPMFPNEPACDFSDGIAKVSGTYIDKSGKTLDGVCGIGMYKNGLIASYDSDTHKYGFINLKGETVIPFEYRWARDFSSCGLALVFSFEDGPCDENAPDNVYGRTACRGYINACGEVVIPIEYYSPFNAGASHLYPVHKGHSGVIELYKEGYTYYFNTDGTVIGKKPGLFSVEYEGKRYLINLAEYYDDLKRIKAQ